MHHCTEIFAHVYVHVLILCSLLCRGTVAVLHTSTVSAGLLADDVKPFGTFVLVLSVQSIIVTISKLYVLYRDILTQ